MSLQSYYLEEGFPFRNRKLENLKKFLSENALTYELEEYIMSYADLTGDEE